MLTGLVFCIVAKTYAEEYVSQELSKQIAFYMRKNAAGTPELVKNTMDKAKEPGVLNVEHIVELQRAKTLFKGAKPAAVSEAAWKLMQTAVSDEVNSVSSCCFLWPAIIMGNFLISLFPG